MNALKDVLDYFLGKDESSNNQKNVNNNNNKTMEKTKNIKIYVYDNFFRNDSSSAITKTIIYFYKTFTHFSKKHHISDDRSQ